MKKRVILLLMMVFAAHSCLYAQGHVIDSLLQKLEQEEGKNGQVNIMVSLSKQYIYRSPDTATSFASRALDLSKQIPYPRGEADAINCLAIISLVQGRYDEALQYCEASIVILKELDAKEAIAGIEGNMGLIYYNQGQYPKAIAYHQRALAIHQKLGEDASVASSYNNIGLVHWATGNYPEALEAYQNCRATYQRLGDIQGEADALLNIGNLYYDQQDFDKALDFFEKSLTTQQQLGTTSGIADALGSIALIYYEKGEIEKSLQYDLESLEILKKIGDRRGLATSLNNIGVTYFEIGEYQKAIEFQAEAMETNQAIGNPRGVANAASGVAKSLVKIQRLDEARKFALQALQIAEEINALIIVRNASELLMDIEDQSGDKAAAYQYARLYMETKDSLFNEDQSKEIAHLEAEWKFDQLKAKADAEKILEDRIKSDRQLMVRNIFATIVAALIAVALLIFRAYRIKSEANKLLSDKNQKIQSQRDDLAKLNKEIQEQKEEILIQHEELQQTQEEVIAQRDALADKDLMVSSSINYAQRIQQAVLPRKEEIDAALGAHFVFYVPRNTVSGDFYYIKKIKNKVIFAVADCTGHGVPGAFVSMLGISFLNELVRREEMDTAAQFLEALRNEFKSALHQKHELVSQRDGMDIALCILDTDTQQLQYAGAYRPLFIMRDRVMIEYKGNRQPIGIHLREHPFDNHAIQLQKDDILYLFSDGYMDQTGGELGKKFMLKKFREMLLEISTLPLPAQKAHIEQEWDNWKGHYSQVDDVLVMGIRV